MLEDGTFELLPLFLENLQKDLEERPYKPRVVWFVRGRDDENPALDDERRVHEYFGDTLADEIREALDTAVFFKTLLTQLRMNPGLKFTLQDGTAVPVEDVVNEGFMDVHGSQPEVRIRHDPE